MRDCINDRIEELGLGVGLAICHGDPFPTGTQASFIVTPQGVYSYALPVAEVEPGRLTVNVDALKSTNTTRRHTRAFLRGVWRAVRRAGKESRVVARSFSGRVNDAEAAAELAKG